MEITKAMLQNVPNPAERKSSTEEFTDSPNETNRFTVLPKQHLLHYSTSFSSVIIQFLKFTSDETAFIIPPKKYKQMPRDCIYTCPNNHEILVAVHLSHAQTSLNTWLQS
jgi:hypothetical protein